MSNDTDTLPKRKKLTKQQAIALLKQSQDWINKKICFGRMCSACSMRNAKEPSDTILECAFYPLMLAYDQVIGSLEAQLIKDYEQQINKSEN